MCHVYKSLHINQSKSLNHNKSFFFTSDTISSSSSSHHKLTKFLIPSLLKKFAKTQQSLTNGKKTHAIILQMGLQSDPFIASSLISLYFKSHSPIDAHNLFAQLPHTDSTIWNSMLSGYLHCQQPQNALTLLTQMQFSGVRPDGHSLTILLKACSDNSLKFEHGKQAHGYIITKGLGFDPILSTALIDMYSKCGDVENALKVFDGSVYKSVSMGNAMIAGFYRGGMWEKSLELFILMMFEGFVVESATVSSVLMACSIGEATSFGEEAHCYAVKMGFEFHPYVSASLVVMYGKFGWIDDAQRIFYGVVDKRIEHWNSMVSVYIGNGHLVGLGEFGRKIHGELIKRPELVNITIQSSLITMYMKCGSTENAIAVFDSTKDRDLVTWGSMIVGFCQNQHFDKALCLFNRLRAEGMLPDSPIIASVASACTGLDCLEVGYQIHGHATKCGASSDQFVGSALIDMYSKLGLPQLASDIFSSLPLKNLVVLNSMISGFGRNCLINESIGIFSKISEFGLVPDSISVTSLLASISSFAALKKGKMVHGYQIRNGITSDILVENSLLDMYMKCGCLSYVQFIFKRMQSRNAISWNSMVDGYGSHGHCDKAIQIFEEMEKSDILPDDTTFLSLLSSCSHSGLVEGGNKIFDSMRRDYGIVPRMEHYVNMVDLFSRAGRLKEAYSFIQGMPIKPDESIWLCLLSSCRAHRCLNLGEVAADELLNMKPKGSGSYTQVLNFYGEMGLMQKAASVRMEMKRAGIAKNPGCSWIEVKDSVELFYSGGSPSLLSSDIYFVLRSLRRIMREIDDFL